MQIETVAVDAAAVVNFVVVVAVDCCCTVVVVVLVYIIQLCCTEESKTTEYIFANSSGFRRNWESKMEKMAVYNSNQQQIMVSFHFDCCC